MNTVWKLHVVIFTHLYPISGKDIDSSNPNYRPGSAVPQTISALTDSFHISHKQAWVANSTALVDQAIVVSVVNVNDAHAHQTGLTDPNLCGAAGHFHKKMDLAIWRGPWPSTHDSQVLLSHGQNARSVCHVYLYFASKPLVTQIFKSSSGGSRCSWSGPDWHQKEETSFLSWAPFKDCYLFLSSKFKDGISSKMAGPFLTQLWDCAQLTIFHKCPPIGDSFK